MATINPYNWLNTLVLLGALQGFILTTVIWQKKGRNTNAVKYLLLLLIITSALLVGKYIYSFGALAKPLLVLIIYTDAIALLFGPMIYFFTRSLLRMPLPPNRKMIWHYVPSLTQLTIFNAIICLSWLGVYSIVDSHEINMMYFGLEVVAMISFGTYTYYSYQTYRQYETAFFEKFSAPQLPAFFKGIFSLFAILLALWVTGFVLKFSKVFADDFDMLYYGFWISVSLFVYLITYKILLNPQLLALPGIRTKPQVDKQLNLEGLEPLKLKLEQFMEEEKPYLNPNLSLDDLAAALYTSRHELSRVINLGFGKNFFDFINNYRVQSFIEAFSPPEKAIKRTFLEVAYEVGFNSKSAFNRAFRKETKQSPSEYLKSANASNGARKQGTGVKSRRAERGREG